MGFFSTKQGRRREDETPAQFSKRLLQQYDAGRDHFARNALVNYHFRDGKQFTAEELNQLGQRKHAAISWNMVHPLIENLKAIITANQPRFTATGVEDSDGRMADLVSSILEYIWVQNAGKQQLEYHVDDYTVGGMGVWLAYRDPEADGGRGEVYFRSVDPLKVYIDPASKDRYARDAQHILLVEQYTREQILNHYHEYLSPEQIDTLEEATDARLPSTNNTYLSPEDVEVGNDTQKDSYGVNPDSEEEAFYEVIERYSTVQRRIYEVNDRTNGRQITCLSSDELQDKLTRITVVIVDGRPIIADAVVGTYMELTQGQEPLPDGSYLAHYQQDPQQGAPVLVAGQADPENPAAIPDSTVQFVLADALSYRDMLEFDGLLTFRDYIKPVVERVISVGETDLYQETLNVSQIPIIPVMNRHNRNPYPRADVEMIRGLQRFYNKLQSLLLAHTANATSPKIFVPRGTDIEELNVQMSAAGFGAVEVDMDTGSPMPFQVPSLSNQVFASLQETEMKMKQIIGVYDLMAGDSSSAPTTYYATMAIEEFGQRRMRSKRDAIEHGLNLLGQVLLELAQDTYGEQKIVRLFDPNFETVAKTITLNEPVYDELTRTVTDRVNDLSTIKCDVRVVSGSTLPTNRWARFEQMKELYNLGLVDQTAVLKEADIPNRDSIIERMGIMQQLQQQLQQAHEEIKQLKGDLQTRERESFHSRARAELEKFKSRLKDDEVAHTRQADRIIQQTQQGADAFINELTSEQPEQQTQEPTQTQPQQTPNA